MAILYAWNILLAAMVQTAISFNLACYAAQMGDLNDARDCLRHAVASDEELKQKALEDPDLAPL